MVFYLIEFYYVAYDRREMNHVWIIEKISKYRILKKMKKHII